MGFKKPKKELGRFLKDENGTFAKNKLIKFSLAMGTVAVGMGFLLNGAVIAAHSNVDETHVDWETVPGTTTCQRLVPTHQQHSQHSSHSSHGNHVNY